MIMSQGVCVSKDGGVPSARMMLMNVQKTRASVDLNSCVSTPRGPMCASVWMATSKMPAVPVQVGVFDFFKLNERICSV